MSVTHANGFSVRFQSRCCHCHFKITERIFPKIYRILPQLTGTDFAQTSRTVFLTGNIFLKKRWIKIPKNAMLYVGVVSDEP